MDSKRKFSILHMYQRIGNYGFGPGLTCPNCGSKVVVRIRNEEPVLQCYLCKTITEPGLDYVSMIEQALLAMDIKVS